jgi:general stress protein 26
MTLDFESALREKHKKIADVKEMVLSTCADNHVTSRVVTVACFENTVYFLSWKHHTKCIQITRNPLVSFCHDNLEMNGTAVLHGDPKAESNKEIAEKYKLKQPLIYRYFSRIEGMIIVEVKISYIKAWLKEESGYFIEYIDIPNCKAFRLRPEDEM